MLRKNSGITLITLIFTIIVIIILTSIFIATSMNALKEARKTEIQSEIHTLEEAISVRYTSYIKNNKSSNASLIGISPPKKEKLSTSSKCIEAIERSITLSGDAKSKMEKEIDEHFDEYVKIITPYEASALGVESLKPESVYIVDYYTSIAYGPIIKEYTE